MKFSCQFFSLLTLAAALMPASAGAITGVIHFSGRVVSPTCAIARENTSPSAAEGDLSLALSACDGSVATYFERPSPTLNPGNRPLAEIGKLDRVRLLSAPKTVRNYAAAQMPGGVAAGKLLVYSLLYP